LQLINAGELVSDMEGKSRRITVKSINEYIEVDWQRKRSAAAVPHPTKINSHVPNRDVWFAAASRSATPLGLIG
jgi:hypothetical protein